MDSQQSSIMSAFFYIENDDDIQRLLLAIPKSDAIRKAQKDAEGFARRAETYMLNFPDKPERNELVDMTRYIIERKK